MLYCSRVCCPMVSCHQSDPKSCHMCVSSGQCLSTSVGPPGGALLSLTDELWYHTRASGPSRPPTLESLRDPSIHPSHLSVILSLRPRRKPHVSRARCWITGMERAGWGEGEPQSRCPQIALPLAWLGLGLAWLRKRWINGRCKIGH